MAEADSPVVRCSVLGAGACPLGAVSADWMGTGIFPCFFDEGKFLATKIAVVRVAKTKNTPEAQFNRPVHRAHAHSLDRNSSFRLI